MDLLSNLLVTSTLFCISVYFYLNICIFEIYLSNHNHNSTTLSLPLWFYHFISLFISFHSYSLFLFFSYSHNGNSTLGPGSHNTTTWRFDRVSSSSSPPVPLTLMCILSEHTAAVNKLAVSPDQSYFASGSSDCCIKIWQLRGLDKAAFPRSIFISISVFIFIFTFMIFPHYFLNMLFFFFRSFLSQQCTDKYSCWTNSARDNSRQKHCYQFSWLRFFRLPFSQFIHPFLHFFFFTTGVQ